MPIATSTRLSAFSLRTPPSSTKAKNATAQPRSGPGRPGQPRNTPTRPRSPVPKHSAPTATSSPAASPATSPAAPPISSGTSPSKANTSRDSPSPHSCTTTGTAQNHARDAERGIHRDGAHEHSGVHRPDEPSPLTKRPLSTEKGSTLDAQIAGRPKPFGHQRFPANGWSIYGAQRAQPVATGGKWHALANG